MVKEPPELPELLYGKNDVLPFDLWRLSNLTKETALLYKEMLAQVEPVVKLLFNWALQSESYCSAGLHYYAQMGPHKDH